MAMDYLNYAKDLLNTLEIKLLPYIFPVFSALNDICIKAGSLLNLAELLLLLEISVCYGFLCSHLQIVHQHPAESPGTLSINAVQPMELLMNSC